MAKETTGRSNNAVEYGNSRYVQGGTTDRFQNRLGWWERRKLQKRDDDLKFIVGSQTAQRPDLIAFQVYGRVQLAWLVLQYNNIVDEKEELLPGTVLRLPTERRVTLDILTRSPGGKPVS